MANKFNSSINVNDIADKKTRDVLMRLCENAEYSHKRIIELEREIELLKRKAV